MRNTMLQFLLVATFVSVCLDFSLAADTDYLKNTITDHFSDTRNHEVNNVYKTQAKEFIFNEFKRFGLETVYHNFSYQQVSPTIQFANVVGVLKGTNFGTAKDRIVGLGAHYDTVQDTKGVDDNGAGVAAMLEVARQLNEQTKKGVKRDNTILLASFDLEEYGYVGSELFISQWLNKWLHDNYGDKASELKPYGVIILDTMMEFNTSVSSQTLPPESVNVIKGLFPETFKSIASDGFKGDFLTLIYRDQQDTDLANSLKNSWNAEKRAEFQIEAFGIPNNETVMHLFENFFRSDHRNFWTGSIPAIFLTDSANFRGDMIKCYHHPCDNLEVMLTDDNIRFLGKTADSIARTLENLSGSSGTGGSGMLTGSVVCLISSIVAMIHRLL